MPEQNPAPAMTYWDSVATTRWGKYIIEVEKDLLLKAHEMVSRADKAVDWGCGSGRWSKLLGDLGWQMTCVDVDKNSLEICRRNVPAAVHLLADGSPPRLQLQDQSANLLMCIEVGPVIESDRFFSEARRVLKPGGVLVCVFWNRLSWRGLACRLKYRLTGSDDAAKFYNFSFAHHKRELRKAGFEICEAEGFCWWPFGRASDSSWIPFCIRMERALRLNRCIALSPWVAAIARKVE
jgi:SAM-dependent methyltransferase